MIMYRGRYQAERKQAQKKCRKVYHFLLAAAMGILCLMAMIQPLTRSEALAGSDFPAGTNEVTSETTFALTTEVTVPKDPSLPDAVAAFAADHGLCRSDYPKEILDLLKKNPEAEEFVVNYPIEHDKVHPISMDPYKNSEQIPLFLQWDKQWGYLPYGNTVAGISACGPLCLAMAGWYLTGDEWLFRPDRVIEFATQEGYCVPGNGSSWTLFSEGAVKLGLQVAELPLDYDRIAANLEAGYPVVCIMGPGDFTSSGHYIVLSGIENGKFRVNDPNSPLRSRQLWEYDVIKDQIENIWVLFR